MNNVVLLERFSLISQQVSKVELRIVLDELQQVLDKGNSGAVVEFGCYSGTTSLFIARVLARYAAYIPFHVYDSFIGLPAKGEADQSPAGMQFTTGQLAVSKASLIKNFKQAGLNLPIIHKGWFNALTGADIPKPITFAFLDGDYYESIMQSLLLIENHLAPGAVVIIDDYQSEALPGAAKATDKWLQKYPQYKLNVQASLAIIHT